MATTQASNQAELPITLDERTFAEELPTLGVQLYPEQEASAFHTENGPGEFQRHTIIERKGPVDVRCEHKDVIHGYFSEDEGPEVCSLIVLEFSFTPNSTARRIKKAEVTITFAAQDEKPRDRKRDDPEVVAMYPVGLFYVEPTHQHEKLVTGAGVNAGGGLAGAQIGGSINHERTIELDTLDATRIRGSIDLKNRNWGPKNSVSWTLLENATSKKGVAASIQAAILLKRQDWGYFTSMVAIKVTADARTRIGAVFESDPQDDIVWFDPQKKPTNKLMKYDVDNLGAIPLKSVCNVNFGTILKATTREGKDLLADRKTREEMIRDDSSNKWRRQSLID